MKTRISATPLIIVILFLSSCNAGQVITPTLTPTLTSTLPPTATLIPTQKATPIPVSLAYTPVPRWMILNQPFYNVEIFGEIWNYTDHRRSPDYACIDYQREKGPFIQIEQCFALVYDETVSFDSQRDLFLRDGFEELTPQNTFGDTGQIALFGKRVSDDPKKVIEFFEIVGIENYVSLVELYIEIDDASSLQAIYEKQVADVMDYVLQDSLQKSHFIPLPAATPLSVTQEGYYAALGNKLITELEASTLYEGTWEALGDIVDPKNPVVCRIFEDRTNIDFFEGGTNVDYKWIHFQNCIFLVGPNFDFDDYFEREKNSENVFLESSHQYDNKFVLYGQSTGHTFFNAYTLDGEYLYYVGLESQIIGEATVDNVFTKEVDDFIYAVLMSNLEK